MQKELFKGIRKPKTDLEIALRMLDKRSFGNRMERLTYLREIYPYGLSTMDSETYYILEELKLAYVNGTLISTIILSQAFIERKIQMDFMSIGLKKESRKGLKFMLDFAKQRGLINNYFYKRIDILRRKRNPFAHYSDLDNPDKLTSRFFSQLSTSKAINHPIKLLERDAKESIRLAYAVLTHDLTF